MVTRFMSRSSEVVTAPAEPANGDGSGSLVVTREASDMSKTLIKQSFCHQKRRSGALRFSTALPWAHVRYTRARKLRVPPQPRDIRVKAGKSVGNSRPRGTHPASPAPGRARTWRAGACALPRRQLRRMSHDFGALLRLSGREPVSGYGPVTAPVPEAAGAAARPPVMTHQSVRQLVGHLLHRVQRTCQRLP